MGRCRRPAAAISSPLPRRRRSSAEPGPPRASSEASRSLSDRRPGMARRLWHGTSANNGLASNRQKAPRFVPVGVGKRDDRQPARDNCRQACESLGRGIGSGAEPARESVARLGPLGQIAGILDWSPRDGERRPPPGAATPCKGLQTDIRCDVDALCRRPNQGRRRGKHQKQLDRVVSGQSIECDRAPELWFKHSLGAGNFNFRSEAVIDRRRCVHDAAQAAAGSRGSLREPRLNEALSATSPR